MVGIDVARNVYQEAGIAGQIWTPEESAALTEMHRTQAAEVAPSSEFASRPIRGVLP
jgi:hypothetical protein